MPTPEQYLGKLANEILKDYENLEGPFNETILPEKKVIDDIEGKKDRSLYLTLTASINYRKETEGENGLWKTSKKLWDKHNWVFRPSEVTEKQYSKLIDIFSEAGFNWQDSHIWYKICLALKREFNSNPVSLLEENEYDALQTLEFIKNKEPKKFPYLKGDKISSLWLRLMHEEVQELENIEEIDMPVDIHIISVTNELMDRDYTNSEKDKKEIRNIWKETCEKNGIVPVRLDQPLWLIHKYWEKWGNEYIAKKAKSLQTNDE